MTTTSSKIRLPDFLIIGEMRCGTTTMWDVLRQHPRVFFPAEKELHYFASYTCFDHHGRYENTDIAEYAHQFAGARDGQLCGEATPNYLFDDGACERIRSALPDVRLLAILRDPVVRAWSHYWHQIRQLNEDLSFEDALDAEADRISSGSANDRDAYSYVTRGRYVESLKRFEAVFGREQMCVAFLEDFKRDGLPAMVPVFDHLRLDAAPMPAEFGLPSRNQAGYPKWPRLDGFCRAARRWAEVSGPLIDVPVSIIANLTRHYRIYSGRPRMSDSIRTRLEQEFERSDRELEGWLGRSVPWRNAATDQHSGTGLEVVGRIGDDDRDDAEADPRRAA